MDALLVHVAKQQQTAVRSLGLMHDGPGGPPMHARLVWFTGSSLNAHK
jgi:hypothetical protein